MGEIATSSDPDDQLVCLGLGSCIAVCLYDPVRRTGAMGHVVLAVSRPATGGLATRYADIAVPRLLAEMTQAGCPRTRIGVALCGGAQIFPGLSGVMDIGSRNVEAVRRHLREVGLSSAADDVGGAEGRTVTLNVATGVVTVRTVRGGERVLANLGGH
jgi:chemotaxis protein CheD